LEEFVAAVIVDTPDSLKEYVGNEIGVSEWLAITQERIAQFAEATEDRQWIHLDRERAEKESSFGTTIAHGFLTLSLISRFMKDVIQVRSGIGMTINYGLNRVRFPAPVRAGSRIRARVTLLSVKEVSGAYEASFSVTVESEGGEKPCCVAESIVRYYR
jgi:acyl dehydratase